MCLFERKKQQQASVKMGKSKKNNDKVGSPACAMPDATSTVQEPTEEAVRDDVQEGDVEQWDFVKVVDQVKEPCACRSDGCESKAVVVWKSSFDPTGEDVWPLCEECQEKDFGGWPDEVKPPNSTMLEISDKESDLGEGPSPLDDPEKNPHEPEANNTLTSEETEVELQEDAEQWDFVKVIDQDTESCACRTDDCGNKAVVVWQSSFDPKGEDVWPLCEECQEKDFGGWPENLTPPATSDDKEFDEEDSDPLEDATDADGGWDLKKIIPKHEIIEFPIQCEDPGCNLLAAVVWVSNSNPSEKWRGCLDCQVKT